MKILLINQCHYKRGGADIVYLNTGKLLLENGHDVVYFSANSKHNELIGQNEHFVSHTNYRKLSLFKKITASFKYLYNNEVYLKLRKLIDKEKPDIAHVHLFHGVLSISVLDALHSKKIPVIHTIHDYRLLCPVSTFIDTSGKICEDCAGHMALSCIRKKCSENNYGQSFIVSLENIFHRKLKRKTINNIQMFHFVSEFAKEKHLQYMPEIVNKSKVLYNFTQPVNHPNFTSTGNYFLFFGRLSKVKGVKTLLEVFMSNSYSKLLKVVGEGDLSESFKAFSNQKKNSEIEFLGYKAGKELVELIQNAFFVVVPSEWYENNPMTIIEAYSYGIPVIGANIGGIPEIIEENKSGFIFKSGNSNDLNLIIKKALQLDEIQYLNMRKEAFNSFKNHFSEKVHYKELIKLYKYCKNQI